MSALKKLYYRAASMLPQSFFRSGGPMGLLLPYHHVVSNNHVPHISQLYNFKNIAEFTKDLDFLIKNYNPTTVAAVSTAIYEKKSLPPGSFLLTFDDGFSEVYDIIAPLLEKKGIPAIFFINPAFVDNKNLFYRCKISLLIDELKKDEANLCTLYSRELKLPTNNRDVIIETLKKINQTNTSVLDSLANALNFSFVEYLDNKKPFLSSTQIIDLHKRGFTIGAHSMNHPYYKLITPGEQVKQTIDSCNYVKELLGVTECHFSFPHSDADISQSVIDTINQQHSGLLFGIQNQKKELNNNILHRFNAERPETDGPALVKGQIILNSIQQLTGRHRVHRN